MLNSTETLQSSSAFLSTTPRVKEEIPVHFQGDLAQIERIEKERDFALNTQSKGRSRIRDSYNWALERAKFNALKTPEQRKGFRDSRSKQLETVLRERYHVATSTVYLSLDDEGNAYDPRFPDEPFDNIILRGVVWALTQDSPEMDREQAVLEGWVKSRQKLADPNTPIGAKMVSLSPGGMVEDTTYRDNYVDILEAVLDPVTGKRMIKKTRFTSGCSNSQYFDLLVSAYPDFPKLKGPFDALALANPIYTTDPRDAEQLFTEDFAKGENVMPESDFEEVWDAVKELGESHLDALFAGHLDPVRIQLTLNAFLHKADEESGIIQSPSKMPVRSPLLSRGSFEGQKYISFVPQNRTRFFKSIEEEIQWRGMQEIAVVIGGCGKLGGISLNQLGSGGFSIEYGSQYLRTSPGTALNLAGGGFSEKKKWDYHKGNCVVCKNSNLEVGPCEICKSCEKTFN